MRPKQLTKLSEEIKHGYKFLRACHYDAKSKRLELTLGTDVHDGFARLVNIEAATEPPDLAKWTGHEIYGIRFYHRLDRAEVQIDFGPTITFDVYDEPETESQREEAKT